MIVPAGPVPSDPAYDAFPASIHIGIEIVNITDSQFTIILAENYVGLILTKNYIDNSVTYA
ncbi:hypothetical protein BGZ95_002145 [Linnemannia exigua]|uniref:Uncharacterized protein n=1 Tax=Linnemannia exigua TaxID=604196 RepID=A0AAD4D5Y1_9FUNG|nr:hypothetical protein BGZ95_002145 [Linnemannia exigua]